MAKYRWGTEMVNSASVMVLSGTAAAAAAAAAESSASAGGAVRGIDAASRAAAADSSKVRRLIGGASIADGIDGVRGALLLNPAASGIEHRSSAVLMRCWIVMAKKKEKLHLRSLSRLPLLQQILIIAYAQPHSTLIGNDEN